MKLNLLLLTASAALLCGCQTYVYRIVKPPATPDIVAKRPVSLAYAPLEYRLERVHGRLGMQIQNPTAQRVTLVGDQSYVVGPNGDSHPLRDRMIGPHSFVRMLLPPQPIVFPYPDYATWGWGWGWGWGPYSPYWDPFYGSAFWGPPPLAYYRLVTDYDWEWKTGPAHLHLTYRQNQSTFAHDFEFVREPEK